MKPMAMNSFHNEEKHINSTMLPATKPHTLKITTNGYCRWYSLKPFERQQTYNIQPQAQKGQKI